MDSKHLTDGLKKGDKGVIELLYKSYYTFLCTVAEHITHNTSDAEEIVSDVFLKLWNNRQSIHITSSLKSYLVKAVQNTSINYLEKNQFSKGQTSSLETIPQDILLWDNDYPLGRLYEKEITRILEKGISALPEGCREIFLLSRNQDLSYHDIAIKLDISVNTVKTQIKIAIARLREVLKDYLYLLLLIINF